MTSIDDPKESSMNLARIAVVAAFGLAAVAFAGVLQPADAGSATDPASGGITVLGTGSANVTPDRAGFAFGTVSQARTASAALAASTEAVTRVVAALQRAGVAKADIQTADVSLSARWDEQGETIQGYTVSNTVTATVRKLGDAGAVIDAAVAAGANQMSGPNLLTSDQASAYRDALKAAIADARAKAQTLATASNVTTGRITAIAEASAAPPPMPLAARDSVTQIEPGTQKIEATVSVTFALG
jgi:hypothetical protein